MIANTNQLGGGDDNTLVVAQRLQEEREKKEGKSLREKKTKEYENKKIRINFLEEECKELLGNLTDDICTLIKLYHTHFDNYVQNVNKSRRLLITNLHSYIIDRINQITDVTEILDIMHDICVIDNDDINDCDMYDIYANLTSNGDGKQIGGGLIDELKAKIKLAIAPPKVLPINIVTLNNGGNDNIIEYLAIQKLTCISLKSTDTYMEYHDFSNICNHNKYDYSYCEFYMRKHPFSNIKVEVKKGNVDDKFEISLIDIGNGSGVATNKEIQFNLILTRGVYIEEIDDMQKETYIFNTKTCQYITDKLKQILDAVKEEKNKNNKQINDVQIPDIRASLQKIITFMPELLILASADIIIKIANNQIKNLFQTSACQQFTQYQRGTCWMCSVLNAIVLQDMNSIGIKIKESIKDDIDKVKKTFNVNTFIRQYVQILKPYFNLITTDLDSGGWPLHTYYNITGNKILNLSLKPIDIMKRQPFDYLKPGIYFLYTLKHAAVFYILDNFLYYLIDSHLNIPCIPYDTCDSNMNEKISIGKVFCIYEAKPEAYTIENIIDTKAKLVAIENTHKLLFDKNWYRTLYFVTFKEYFEYQQYLDSYNDDINKNITLTLDEQKIEEIKKKLTEIKNKFTINEYGYYIQPGARTEYGINDDIKINTIKLYNKVSKISSLDIYNIGTPEEVDDYLHLNINYTMNEERLDIDIDIDKTLKFDIRDYLFDDGHVVVDFRVDANRVVPFHTDDNHVVVNVGVVYDDVILKYISNIEKLYSKICTQKGSGHRNKYKVYKLNGNYYALYKNRKIIITRLNILDKIEYFKRSHI
jgi:hypothetical protein